MKLHNELEYKDLEKVNNKIVVTDDVVKPIYQVFALYSSSLVLSHDFESLNIELLIGDKINIYIENEDEEKAMITFFHNEKKIISFEIEYVIDMAFYVEYIFEYAEFQNYNNSVEEIILFATDWFVKILFYKQWHFIIEEQKGNSITFFINTKNSKLEDTKKSR